MKLRVWLQSALVVAALCLCTGTSSAYYYYIHFPSHSGPFTPIPDKFDLNSLPNKTVNFYLSDQGPAALYSGDSFAAIASEVRAAAKVWNDVSTSDLRIAYGGLLTSGTTESAPGIDVQFSSDIPPGLLALGGPQSTGGIVSAPNGSYVPIAHSKLLLPLDMSQTPSFSEQFFVTLVHEFGHTLGLQHTLTSSVMSTSWTSASTKANPLGADDIAGISLLYPAQNYSANIGTISGRVTINGSGVNLASVVALPVIGAAVSGVTNPDGTYQISGLTPGVQYYVYAHPLPPPLPSETTPANITYPVDSNGSSDAFHPNYTAFVTQFYPNTSDPNQAQPLSVVAGGSVTGINFAVKSKSAQAVNSVRVYGYSITNVALPSPELPSGGPTWAPLVATGVGLLQNNNTALANGLGISVFQGAGVVNYLQVYSGTSYALLYVQPSYDFNTLGTGPRHLLFTTPSDLYVLPSAYSVVKNQPPWLNTLTSTTDASGNRAVAISGSNLFLDTRIYFDGMPGIVEGFDTNGKLLVTPPPGPPGYTATVTALNSDGQSSLFLQGQYPSTYTYDGQQDTPLLFVSPNFLFPGVDTTVSITLTNTNATSFVDGQTVVGFGTSDVQVRKVTVVDATHITVVASSNVLVPTSGLNVTTGLRILSTTQGAPVFQSTLR